MVYHNIIEQIEKGGLFEFIANEGHNLSHDTLKTLAKELAYMHEENLTTKYLVSELREQWAYELHDEKQEYATNWLESNASQLISDNLGIELDKDIIIEFKR